MAKKKVQMKVLGSSGYDDICPVPAEHASSHGKNGTDQISPVDIGAQSEIPITSNPDPNVNIWIDPDEDDLTQSFYTKSDTDILLQNNDPRQWGLGGNAKMVNVQELDLDTLKTTGWYATSNTEFMYSWLNKPEKLPRKAGLPIVRVESLGSSFLMQTYIYLPEASIVPYIAKRICVNNTFYPWEYVNPPMEIGVEYRTTERNIGKPVYVKTLDFGALPNNTSKTVSTGFEDYEIMPIDVYGYYYVGADRHTIPFTYNNTVELTNFNGTLVTIKTNFNASSYNAYVTTKYTKDAD